jgi:hypothetical protein
VALLSFGKDLGKYSRLRAYFLLPEKSARLNSLAKE